MIPSVAYIGGPAETAYLAQSEVLYAELLGRMPVAVPRTGFTILDARSAKLMDRYGMGLKNFFFSDDVVRGEIAAKLVPPHLTNTIEQTASTVDAAVGRLKSELTSFDPTLARALENSSRKISYQLQKIRGKTEREALRRDVRATRDAASLSGLIYPERHLQERLYSILPLLAKHGLELVGQLYASIELDCSDHRLLVL
jgi:uncharacterized protein YllA (UPF0747 family)